MTPQERPESRSRLSQELSPEQQAELGDLTELEERLAGYVAPIPTAEETRQLAERLRPLVAARAAAAAAQGAAAAPAGQDTTAAPAGQDTTAAAVGQDIAAASVRSAITGVPIGEIPAAAGDNARSWWQLLRGQALLLEPAFWWAGAGVFLLALVLALLDGDGGAALMLALAAPVLAAAAVAYAFRPAVRALWELERAAPVHPLELLYARLGLVLAGNLGLVMALLVLVWAANPRLVLWRMALVWLGPWFALTGAAFYATVRWGPVAGTGVPVLVWWSLLFALRWTASGPNLPFLDAVAQGLLRLATSSDLALVGAAAALLLGFGLVRAAGRLAVGEAGAWNS